jgi:class 3 adenylate cyclase
MDLQLALDQCERVEEFRRKHRIGLLTLLFTDMVGSTRLKQTLGDTGGFDRIQEHHALVREILARFPEGEEIGTSGDSFFIVFAKPSEAVKFSLLLQSRLRELSENSSAPLLDRIGIHIGEVIIEECPGTAKPKDLYGIQVDICARMMGLGQGDQILMTRSSFDNARQVLKGRELAELGPLTWTSHGLYLLQGVEEPLEVCEVGETGRARLTPPSDSGKARREEAPVRSQETTTATRRWPAVLITVGILAAIFLVGYRQAWFGNKSTVSPLFYCGFEASEGYQTDKPLIGREGWMNGRMQGPAGSDGVAAGLFPGSTQQAFVGGVPIETSPGIHTALKRNVIFSPSPDGNAVVEMDWRQCVTDSASGGRNMFEWLFYNQRGQLLGGLLFNNATCKIMSRGADNSLAPTGLTFERGRVYPMKLRLDFRAKTWTAMVGTAALGPLPLADSNLGSIAVTWWSNGNQAPVSSGPLAGNNRIAFDDLEIVAPD